jgi:ABC-type enterobactin transport system permease subunit
MPTRRRALLILAALCLLAVASLGLALVVGSFRVAPADVLGALFGRAGDGADIVIQLRLPRALAGFACGGLLALAVPDAGAAAQPAGRSLRAGDCRRGRGRRDVRDHRRPAGVRHRRPGLRRCAGARC